MHSGVSVLAKKSRNIDVKVGNHWLVIKAGDQRQNNQI